MDDLDDAAELPAYGGKMGIDATRKWASEGYTRSWPARIRTTEEAGQKAADIWARLQRTSPTGAKADPPGMASSSSDPTAGPADDRLRPT